MRARAEGGFTLLEVLVALAVFSLAAMTLVNMAGENARTAVSLEDKAIAGIVAENRAVEAMVDWPPLGEQAGRERAGDRDWLWTRRVSRTSDPEFVRIDVRVTAAKGGQTLAELTTFRGRR